jgi:vacuolar-type H+-ATPase subunit F/Vma7
MTRDRAHKFIPSTRPGFEHTCVVAGCNGLAHDEEHIGGEGIDPPRSWKPGDICVLGERSVFKVGYVVGPSRKAGKTRVRPFSALARRFCEIIVVADDVLSTLPKVADRTTNQQRTINLAVIASATARRDIRELNNRRK